MSASLRPPTPRQRAQAAERRRVLPSGDGERLAGYGVVGLCFASGDSLAFRRTTASSIGPPFTSVWHRDPAGSWTLYVDVEPRRGCPRWLGSEIDRVVVTDVEVRWTGPAELVVSVPSRRLEWGLRLRSTAATRLTDLLLAVTPDRAWRSDRFVRSATALAAGLLRVGDLPGVGHAPNGQAFRHRVRAVWRIAAAAAIVEGRELGPTDGRGEPAELAGLPVPREGLFAVGSVGYEAFDPHRHRTAVARRSVVRSPPPLGAVGVDGR